MKHCSHLRRYEADIGKCFSCGLCAAVCPAFSQSGEEGDCARGKISLLRALLEGKADAGEIRRRLERCALCGRCSRICPARLPLERIFLAARFDLEPKASPRLALAGFFARMPRFLDLGQAGIFALAKTRSWLGSGKNSRKKALPLAFQPFFPEKREEPASLPKVLLFTGCIARRFYPRIVKACLAALDINGCEGILLKNEVCCGRPFMALGAHGESLKLLRANLKSLAETDFEALLCLCPGCLDAIKNIWPQMDGLDGGEREQCANLAAQARDINSFLAEKSGKSRTSSDANAENMAIAWHRPCLLDEEANAAAEKLLVDAGGKINIPAGAPCCGGAMNIFAALDGFKNKNSPLESPGALGMAAAKALRDALLAAGGAPATACPGCMLALDGAFAKRGDAARAMHSVEIYVKNTQRE